MPRPLAFSRRPQAREGITLPRVNSSTLEGDECRIPYLGNSVKRRLIGRTRLRCFLVLLLRENAIHSTRLDKRAHLQYSIRSPEASPYFRTMTVYPGPSEASLKAHHVRHVTVHEDDVVVPCHAGCYGFPAVVHHVKSAAQAPQDARCHHLVHVVVLHQGQEASECAN
jgi:hypothetical protein